MHSLIAKELRCEGVINPIKRPKSRTTYANGIEANCAKCLGCKETYPEIGFRDLIRKSFSPSCPLHCFRPDLVDLASKHCEKDQLKPAGDTA